MIDREKVINAIECCVESRTRCFDDKDKLCPYFSTKSFMCELELLRDALALLKEQEAVEPKTEPSAKGYWYTCGVCGWWLFEVRDTVHFDDRKRIHFCASCGRSVKWE